MKQVDPTAVHSTSSLRKIILPFFTTRFIKFSCVGASGVGVNLAALFFFADVLRLHANFSSALAIEVSILSNFLLNEYWTFRDRRMESGTFGLRALRFNLVSLVGALVQWSVFVYANLAWAIMIFSPADLLAYHAAAENLLQRWVLHPVLQPPEVGYLMYASQLLGIGIATFWNFLVNVHWTWRKHENGGRS
jgi:putative flippase GtrA